MDSCQYVVQEDIINRLRLTYSNVAHTRPGPKLLIYLWLTTQMRPACIFISNSQELNAQCRLDYTLSISVPGSDADELCQCETALWAKRKQIIGHSVSQTLQTHCVFVWIEATVERLCNREVWCQARKKSADSNTGEALSSFLSGTACRNHSSWLLHSNATELQMINKLCVCLRWTGKLFMQTCCHHLLWLIQK